MTNLEKATKLQEANKFSLRSCWECNPGHEHLKKRSGLFHCIECSRWFMNGGFFNDEKHCEKKFIKLPK